MRPPFDLSVYLVTDTPMCEPLGVAETVRRAVAAGVTIVQLRDPDAPDDEFVALGRAVVTALEGTGVPLIVNDRVHLVAPIGAQGAHVGQDDLSVENARALLGPDAILGLSVHDDTQLAAARPYGDQVDYLGIGPLRATASKSDHAPVRGLEHLRRLASASPWPCVAIGGVKAHDAADLRGAGIAGMAVISAICGQPDVPAATRELSQAWAAAADDGAPDVEPAPTRDGDVA